MFISNISNQPSFNGVTKIFSITDTHQETRKTRAFLSEVLRCTGENKNTLLLSGGDIFKGVYAPKLERDSFIKMIERNPNIKMVGTIGNNDFGFSINSLNFLIDTIKDFSAKGIETICANIFNQAGARPDWLKPYTIVERDEDRNFITGFCINNINTAKFGIVAKNQEEVIDEIAKAVREEKPDNFIILNHDFLPSSQYLYDEFKKRGIEPDLILGGHDHDPVEPDVKRHIYYPESFCRNMLLMNLENNNGVKSIQDLEIINNEGLKVEPFLEQDLQEYEVESGLMQNIAPRVLNLTKKYSEPCPLGTYLADRMKDVSESDVAFFSTGFLVGPLLYEKNGYISNYDLKKTISADNYIETVYLSQDELKRVLQHALNNYGKKASNPKFIQCSGNLRIEGGYNNVSDKWEIKNIYINDELLSPQKMYKCCIDSYIANGGQGFEILQGKTKSPVTKEEKAITLTNVLIESLKKAPDLFEPGAEYPASIIQTV